MLALLTTGTLTRTLQEVMSHAQEENEQHRRDMLRLRAEEAHLEAEEKFKKECQALLQKVRQLQCELRDEQMQEDARVQAMLRQVNRVLRDCDRKKDARASTLRHQTAWTSNQGVYSSADLYNTAPSVQRLSALEMNDPDVAFSSLGAMGLASNVLSSTHRRLSFAAPFTSFNQIPATSDPFDELLNSLKNTGGNMPTEEVNGSSTTHRSFFSDVLENVQPNSPKVKPTDSAHLWTGALMTDIEQFKEVGPRGSRAAPPKDPYSNSVEAVNPSEYKNALQTESNNGERDVPYNSRNSMGNFEIVGTAAGSTDQPMPASRIVHERSGVRSTHQAEEKLHNEKSLSDESESEVSIANSEQDRSLREESMSKEKLRIQNHSHSDDRPRIKTLSDNIPERAKNSHPSPTPERTAKNAEKIPKHSEQTPSGHATSVKAAVVQLAEKNAEQEKEVRNSGKPSPNRTESDDVSSLSMEQPPQNVSTTQQPSQEQIPCKDNKNIEKTPSKAEKTSSNTKAKELHQTEERNKQEYEDYTMKNSDDEFSFGANGGELRFTPASAFLNRTASARSSSSSEDTVEARIRQAQEQREAAERKKAAEVKDTTAASQQASKAQLDESSSSSDEGARQAATAGKPSATAARQLVQSAAQAPKTQASMYARTLAPSNPAAHEDTISDLEDLTGPSIDDDDDDFFQ